MIFSRSGGVRVCGTLAAMLIFTSELWSEGPPLGVRIASGWRPGYHKIDGVFEGSPAKAIGLKPGLVIVSIDGTIVGDPDKVRWDLKDKDRITIVFHDGKHLYQAVAKLKDGKVYGDPKTEMVGPPTRDR